MARSTSTARSFFTSTAGVTLGSTITGNGTITVNGTTASGPSYASLTGDATGFAGNWLIEGGRLQTTASNINAADPITIVGNDTVGGQLFIANGMFSNPITISGIGAADLVANLGAIRLQSETYSGPITLAGDARITAYNSSGTLSGLISDGRNGYALSLGDQDTGTRTARLASRARTTRIAAVRSFSAPMSAPMPSRLGTGPITLSNATSDTAVTAITENTANALTGNNSLTVQIGTATLSQSNNYTGGTTVSGGTVAAFAAGAREAATC